MSKRQLMDAIRELNPTAQLPFLLQFGEGELQEYLERLQDVVSERIRIGEPIAVSGSKRLVS